MQSHTHPNTQESTTDRTLALVGCGAAKRDLEDGELVPAKDLYTSSYFDLKRRYAEAVADEWAILSAGFGYVPADTLIPTYDARLTSKTEAKAWAEDVGPRLRDALDSHEIDRVVFLAGRLYREPLFEYVPEDVTLVDAFDGFGGIGGQMGFLSDELGRLENSTGAE